MRDLLEILKTALPNFPSSALRIFDEWVAPFERRFDDTFRPVACKINGSVLTLSLADAGELLIDHPAKLTISPEIFRVGDARSVRLNGTIVSSGPETPRKSYVIEYKLDGTTVTRRDADSSRSFPYNLEAAAVEFVTG